MHDIQSLPPPKMTTAQHDFIMSLFATICEAGRKASREGIFPNAAAAQEAIVASACLHVLNSMETDADKGEAREMIKDGCDLAELIYQYRRQPN